MSSLERTGKNKSVQTKSRKFETGVHNFVYSEKEEEDETGIQGQGMLVSSSSEESEEEGVWRSARAAQE